MSENFNASALQVADTAVHSVFPSSCQTLKSLKSESLEDWWRNESPSDITSDETASYCQSVPVFFFIRSWCFGLTCRMRLHTGGQSLSCRINARRKRFLHTKSSQTASFPALLRPNETGRQTPPWWGQTPPGWPGKSIASRIVCGWLRRSKWPAGSQCSRLRLKRRTTRMIWPSEAWRSLRNVAQCFSEWNLSFVEWSLIAYCYAILVWRDNARRRPDFTLLHLWY